jgi:hypothetical protein
MVSAAGGMRGEEFGLGGEGEKFLGLVADGLEE